MPSATGWPLVGVLPQIVRDPLAFVMDAHREYGDIYHLNLGITKIVMLNHPRHAQHVLIDNARNYTKAGPIWDSLRTLLGNGLPVSEGAFLATTTADDATAFSPSTVSHDYGADGRRDR